MTDTDKLKRLAEAASFGSQRFVISEDVAQAILALIAENEGLKLEKELGQWPLYSVRKQRDEAVALLRECLNQPMEPWGKVSAFLARIDAAK